VLIVAMLVQKAVLLAATIAIGLWLGLGAPLLRDLLLGVPARGSG
jgi:hypothetical protein